MLKRVLVTLIALPPSPGRRSGSRCLPALRRRRSRPGGGVRVELASGVGVNVIEAGNGPPVVLVHSRPGSAYIPDSELVEFPGGSHTLPVTQTKAVAEHIARFAR